MTPIILFRRLRRFPTLLGAFLLAACSNATDGGSQSPIAGTYQTDVTLASSSCTGITVQDNPTRVSHTTGSTTFTLTHAGNTYSATLGANNTFTTTPKPIVAGTATHTLSIAGQFTTDAFTATVSVSVTGTGNGAPCQYVVHWVGSR